MVPDWSMDSPSISRVADWSRGVFRVGGGSRGQSYRRMGLNGFRDKTAQVELEK